MGASFGKIMAVLAEPNEGISEELIGLINKNVNPPRAVSAADVNIRAMYVVSDEINSFGGRFPAEEHGRLMSLLIDSPVLAGHRKDKLPIGRNFHAVLENKRGRQWVKSYFYWLKTGDGGESLRENIDGGIYKECSIGFTYFFPECSVCGEDMRRCKHEPLRTEIKNGVESVIHFNYRKIERVLETSLVYRGALPDTAVTKDLDEANYSRTPQGEKHPEVFCGLEKKSNSDNARLVLTDGGRMVSFVIRQFNLNRLRHHVRFMAELSQNTESVAERLFEKGGKSQIAVGKVISESNADGQLIIKMEGSIAGWYALRLVKLSEAAQWLFYKLESRPGRKGGLAEYSSEGETMGEFSEVVH